MVNQEFYHLGTAPSVIRQLFAYGLEQAAKVGADKVYDYSLGNPSIPAPKKVNDSIHKIVDETDSIKLHGYSMAPGFAEARAAVAKDLTGRFGLDVKAGELFFTCGAAAAPISSASPPAGIAPSLSRSSRIIRSAVRLPTPCARVSIL